MSFVKKMIASSPEPIHFLCGRVAGGLQCYWFIMCPKMKFDMLATKFQKEELVNLEEYGVIVASGWGSVPTEDVKQQLKADYNFDADALA
jgi:hypothetical protein